MLVELSIQPIDDSHMSDDIARAVRCIRDSGLKYRVGPMSTSIEGDWDAIMPAIRSAHESVAQRHGRVITTITIDDRQGGGHSLDEAVAVVEGRLERATM